ncbi:MAG: 4Fe-4S dicluster domain-containing protein [Deltaproteobacteria bacterium]|nr:4Fe-4S dicluster domain-containing protein [Deltaproteobacteria bacterium]
MSNKGRFLATDKIPGLLKRLGGTYRVFAPVKVSDTVILFHEFKEGAQLALNKQATLPPKEILFPQTECLLSYTYHKDPENLEKSEVQVEETLEALPTIIFGARPCDARGLMVFDAVFNDGQWRDPYYKARRKATTIVTILCTQPENTCFCTSVGGGPTNTEGSDLVLTPVTGGYFAEPATEKGGALLQDEAFALGHNKADEAREEREKVSLESELELDGIAQCLLELFSTDFWKQVSAKCISCGACTYVCPTCYCFNITDETAGVKGERIRTWDSCMFYQYTLEASGHNPRPTKVERYRNRIGHKFSYHPTNYEGMFGCTGCGRCIKACPVSLDIRQVLREVKVHG